MPQEQHGPAQQPLAPQPPPKRVSIKNEMLRELGALAKDSVYRDKIADGVYGDVESVKGGVFAVLARCFELLEQKIDTEMMRQEQVSELLGRVQALERQVNSDLGTMRNSMKDLSLRVIQTLEKNFEVQRSAIEGIPLPIERAIGSIPSSMGEQLAQIRAISESMGAQAADVSRANETLGKTVSYTSLAVTGMSESVQKILGLIEAQNARLDAIAESAKAAGEGPAAGLDALLDGRLAPLSSGIGELGQRAGALDASVLALSATVSSLDQRLGAMQQEDENWRSLLRETLQQIDVRFKAIEKSFADTGADHHARIDEINRRLEVICGTMVNIEVLQAFLANIEKKSESIRNSTALIETVAREMKERVETGNFAAMMDRLAEQLDFSEIEDQMREIKEAVARQIASQTAQAGPQPPAGGAASPDALKELNDKLDREFKDIHTRLSRLQNQMQMER